MQSNNCTKDPNFIRNLTKTVMDHSTEEHLTPGNQANYKLLNSRLEEQASLLNRYINNDSDLELQCICALQQFVTVREYPPGELLAQLLQEGILNAIFSPQDSSTQPLKSSTRTTCCRWKPSRCGRPTINRRGKVGSLDISASSRI